MEIVLLCNTNRLFLVTCDSANPVKAVRKAADWLTTYFTLFMAPNLKVCSLPKLLKQVIGKILRRIIQKNLKQYKIRSGNSRCGEWFEPNESKTM